MLAQPQISAAGSWQAGQGLTTGILVLGWRNDPRAAGFALPQGSSGGCCPRDGAMAGRGQLLSTQGGPKMSPLLPAVRQEGLLPN